jgi:hypothetical protein
VGDHTFVVLAYGASPFLADCLASLRAQSQPSHILVSTSTPSDHVTNAAQAVGADVRVNPDRAGIASDWNFGLAQAPTPFVTLAHQDDVYFPTFTEQTLELFGRHPEAALCFTGYQEIDDFGHPKSSKISKVKHLIEALTVGRREAPGRRRLRAYLSFGNPLPCSSVTFQPGRLTGFTFSADFRSNLDWDAWWRLADAGVGFLHATDRLVGRRHNGLTATSGLIADGTRRAEDVLMLRKAWPRPVAEAIAFAYQAGY